MNIQPSTVPADGNTYATVSVNVESANGSLWASGTTLQLVSSGAADIQQFGAVPDANGWYRAQIRSRMAGSQTLTVVATYQAKTFSLPVSATIDFSPLGASFLYSTLQANPNALSADGVTTTVLTFTARDLHDAPLPHAPVTWSSTGTNNILLAASPNADINGVATATLTSTTAERKTVTATTGALQTTVNVDFLPGAISSPNCLFRASPTLITADNSSASTLTFTAKDGFGNPVPNAPVTFISTGSNNAFSPSAGVTDSNGNFTATLVSSKAETKTITATSGSVVLTQTVTFLAGQPSTTLSTFSASPNVVTADGASTSTLTVVLEDAAGNPVPGQAVTFSSTGSNGTFGQVSGTTDLTGTVTTTLSSTTAENKTVIAHFAGSVLMTDVMFTSGAASSSMTTLSAAPTTVTADGTSASTLTATVRDAFGNPVEYQAISLASTGSNNSITPLSGMTDGSGEFTATLSSTTAEVKTITATSGSAAATAAVTFVAGAPSSGTTTFGASPTSVTANGSAVSTLTVTVEDAQGNPVPNQAVTFVATGANNVFTPASGSTNNVGVFTATLSSTKAEVKNLTATVGAVNKAASVTFVPGPPSSTTTTFGASPNTVIANGSSTTTLTVTVFDAQGNPIPNQSVSLASSGSNNYFGGATGSTNSAGVYTTTLASSTAQVKTLTATAGSANKTTTVTFTAGAPSSTQCTLTANPTSSTADGTSTTQLTFVVQDAFGNAVPNQAVSLSSTGSNNTFTSASGTTNSAGQFVASLSSTKAETKTITGTAGSATATTNVTFNPGPVSATTTTLVANPNTLAADGSTLTTLVTTALDAQGNPVSGQSVVLSGTGTNNSFTPPSGSTDASGVFSATLSSTTVQSEVVSAQVVGTVTANANVTFTTPAVSVSSSTIVASPNALTADGNAFTTITITVLNDSNAPVQSAPVVMSATGGNNTFLPATGSTNASGVFTTTLKSTQAAVKTVTATVEGTALQTTVTFLAGAPVSTTTSLVASPNTVTADGASTSTLTVVVRDVNGNPVPSQTVSLSLSGGNNTLTPASGNTDATGTFTATLASTLAQTENVTANVASFQRTATVNFVPGSVSGVTTTFVANPTTATANGSSAITFTATVRDAEGNPVPSQAVVLSSSGTSNTFAPPSGSTDASGVFTGIMRSAKAEAKTVMATIGSVNKTANVTFTAGAPASTTSTLVVNPTLVTANGNTAAITVTVEDANGNLIANQNVALSGSGTANTFAPASGPTNGNGIFTATLSSTVAQVETLTATVGSATLTASMTFTAGSPNSVQSSLVASPTTLVANGVTTTTLTVTVKDAQGNPVPSQAVSLNSNGTGNTITPLAGNTNVAGVFTATFASTTAQVKLVTATIGGVTETAAVTFTAGSPNSTTTTFVANPLSVTADGASTTTLTVTVEDQYGNPVPNQGVTFSSTGASNTFTQISGSTNMSGVFTATMSSTVAQGKTVTATIGALAPTATVTFVAGAPSATTSSVAASPGMVTANGTNTTSVTVTVKDGQGNLVPNQAVSVAANGSANIWSGSSGTSGSTNTLGVWSTTLASTLAQTETITATIGLVQETNTITFVAGAASGSTSSLTASPTSLADDGVTTTTLQITVEDGTANPISNQPVTFSSSGSGYTFSSATCSTNASGKCSVTLKSSVAESVTVNANFAGVVKTAAVTFVNGAPSNANSSFTASPNSLADNGIAASMLQITVEDSTGNLITGQTVTFTSTGSAYTFSAPTCTTSAGVCLVTLKSSVAQTVTVTAAFGLVTKTAPVTFFVGSPNTTMSALTATPNTVVDDGSTTSTLLISVEDATGNGINAQAVTFSTVGSNYTFIAPGKGLSGRNDEPIITKPRIATQWVRVPPS